MQQVNNESTDEVTLKWLHQNEYRLKHQFKGYPNVIDSLSHSLFTIAGIRGKLKTMKYLLSIGADLNYVQEQTGDNALSAALQYNEYVVADWLRLDKGMTLDIARELEKNIGRKDKTSVERYRYYSINVSTARAVERYNDFVILVCTF